MGEIERFSREARHSSLAGMSIYLLFGLVLWALQLAIVYAGHSLFCAQRIDEAVFFAVHLSATFLPVALLVLFLVGQRRIARWFSLSQAKEDRCAYHRIARLCAILSLAAVIWTGMTAALLDTCGLGR